MLFSRAAPIVLFHDDSPVRGKEFRDIRAPLPGPVQRYGLRNCFETSAPDLYVPFRSISSVS